MENQIGMEKTTDEYVESLVKVFREIKRVLKDDGTFWLNIGDSYVSSATGSLGNSTGKDHGFTGSHKTQLEASKRPSKLGCGLPEKNIIGIPWRVALALQADGWILRQDIIWYKPNTMPESVLDRFTKSFEYIFFLVKSPRYYFEQQFEPFSEVYLKDKRPKGVLPQKLYPESKYIKTGMCKEDVRIIENREIKTAIGRNKRNVWTINVGNTTENHFASYPEELILTPCKAGCPNGGIIIDPFFGTGTTGLVALHNGRNFVGIELNPEYVEIAHKRIDPILRNLEIFG
jgi:DNA modification methylase